MNDFAAPIIQAFMQGQQMKRQTEQDIIAAKERERQTKMQEQQLKRMEQHDKLQLALGTMQLTDYVRKGVGDGSIVTRDPGLEAPQMGPVAQQLMQMQPAQDANTDPMQSWQDMPLPLQQAQGSQASQVPTQLGEAFNIGSTGQFRDPIVDIGGIKIDTRGFRGKEETEKDFMRRQLQSAEAKAYQVSQQESAKRPFMQAAQAQKDAAAMDRTKLTVGAKALQDETTNKFRTAELELKRNALEQARELGKAKIALGYAKKAKNAISEEDAQAGRGDTIAAFKAGTYTKEDIKSLIPQSGREQFISDLRKAGVTPLNIPQRDLIVPFQQMADFANRAEKISELINKGAFQGLPGTDADNEMGQLLADTENFGRGTKGMHGVFSDNDIKLLKGAYPSAMPSQHRAESNRNKVNKIKKDLVFKFNETYKNLPDVEKARIAKETGMINFMRIE